MKSFAARLLVVVLGVSAAGCGGGGATTAPSSGQGRGTTAASREQSPAQGQKDENKAAPSPSRLKDPADAPKGETKTDPKGDKKPEEKVEAKDQLKGVVRYNGKPLTGGQIVFRSAAGESLAADLTKDGTYVIVNPPKGTLKVAVSYVDPKAVEWFRAMSAAGKDKSKPPPAGDPGQFSKIPAKYSDSFASGLSVEYKGGIGTFDFELKDDAPKTEDAPKKGDAPAETPKK